MQMYTASGVHVGKVVDLSFDSDTGMVLEYLVRTGLVATTTIARERVLRIEDSKLIVEDRVSDEITEEQKQSTFTPPDPVALAEEQAP